MAGLVRTFERRATVSVQLNGGAGVVAWIDETGLTSLTLNGVPVLSGGLQAESSGSRFGIADASLGTLLASSFTPVSGTAARVFHQYQNGRAEFLYTLSGEDLTITATVTPTVPITVLGVTGLITPWVFGDVSGLLGGTGTDITDKGISQFHPSVFNPIGAAYRVAPNSSYAICAYPVNAGLQRTLMHWTGIDVGGTLMQTLEWFVVPSTFRYPPSTVTNAVCAAQAPVFSSGIHAQEPFTFTVGLRVSSDTSWAHLLAPYKTQFATTFGPCVYAAARDDRPITISFPGRGDMVGPTNPYGLLAGNYRFDVSATPWCDAYIGAMGTAGCQGVIFWSLNGVDSRFPGTLGGGLNYNPDVHILPAEIEATRPALLSALQGASLVLGRECQPHWVRSRFAWDQDEFYTIAGIDGTALADCLARYDTAIAQGFTRFYCDTFPSTFNDHLILKALRDHWGATSPLVYTEFCTDVSMVYAGAYAEVSGTAPSYMVGAYDNNLQGSGLSYLSIIRWMLLGTSVAVADRSASNWSTAYLDFLYQHQLTPLPQDQELATVSGLPAALAARNATYLVANQFPVS